MGQISFQQMLDNPLDLMEKLLYAKPTETTKLAKWEIDDAKIISWTLGSVDQQIASSVGRIAS